MHKLVLSIILITLVSVSPAFAQEQLSGQKIIINTDKSAYNEGDVITITGNVEKVVAGLPISLQIFFGKNLLEVAQVDVTEDGLFTKTFVATGPMWQNEGTILIKATYGQETNELSFKFFKLTGTLFKSIYEVDIPGAGTFDVKYTMKGGIVTLMELNQNDLSLDIRIDTNTNGAMDIDIPRSSVDSVNANGFDEKFIVLIYKFGEEEPIQTDFTEIESTAESRSIYIPIRDGDMEVQIIGTKVIPEFGVMIQFTLIIAIITAIIISARTKLDIFPKL